MTGHIMVCHRFFYILMMIVLKKAHRMKNSQSYYEISLQMFSHPCCFHHQPYKFTSTRHFWKKYITFYIPSTYSILTNW